METIKNEPGLFGLKRSNRDFASKDSWGKNQFNSSFPAALCAYFESKNIKSNYITVLNDKVIVTDISISDLFGISSLEQNEIFYSFESQFSPFNMYVNGSLPRTDLVIQDIKNKLCIRGLEVKLTALPDQTTFYKTENEYGCELVVRPDTIVYLACSLISNIEKNNTEEFRKFFDIDIKDWSESESVISNKDFILDGIKNISNILSLSNNSSPLLLQPIWKTKGKSPDLSDYCLDLFAWSDVGFARFIHDISLNTFNSKNIKITRQFRTCVWLYKMLHEYFKDGVFNYKKIIDQLSYNIKNDKAFSSQGSITNSFMTCENLIKPRINKKEIKNIILGNGQDLLSPERRFDAIIYNSPDLFKIT